MLLSDWLVSSSEALVDVGTAQQKTLTGALVSSSELLSRIEELILFKKNALLLILWTRSVDSRCRKIILCFWLSRGLDRGRTNVTSFATTAK